MGHANVFGSIVNKASWKELRTCGATVLPWAIETEAGKTPSQSKEERTWNMFTSGALNYCSLSVS